MHHQYEGAACGGYQQQATTSLPDIGITKAKRDDGVFAYVERIEKEVAVLHVAVGELAERITHITTPLPASPAGCTPDCGPANSILAGKLSSVLASLVEARARINNLRAAVDL